MGNDTQSAWSCAKDVALPIDLEPIRSEEGIFTPAGRIEKHATVRDGAVFSDIVGEPGRPIRIDVGHVERLLIRREGNAVQSLDVMDEQGSLCHLWTDDRPLAPGLYLNRRRLLGVQTADR